MSGAKGITLFVDIKGNGSGRDDGEEKDTEMYRVCRRLDGLDRECETWGWTVSCTTQEKRKKEME